MEVIMKIMKPLEDSGLLLKAKEQKDGFLNMLLGTLSASWLGNMLSDKGANREFLYYEIQKYYQNEPRFNGVYSIDNLPDKRKDGSIYNKSWWVFWYWKSLDCFVCIK